MKFRSILMGLLVVLMGMAAGLLLSVLFWPPPAQPPAAPQGLVKGMVPQEPQSPLEPPPDATIQFSRSEAPKAEPDPGVSLDAAKEKESEGEGLHKRESDPEPIQQPIATRESGSPQEKVASSRPRRDSKTTRSGMEKESFSFTLHVESFKSSEAAERRVNVLRGQGLEAFSQPAQVPGKGLFYRVFVGKFQDRAAAGKFLEKLKAEKKVQGGRVVSHSEMGG